MQARLTQTHSDLPGTASQELGLNAYTAVPGFETQELGLKAYTAVPGFDTRNLIFLFIYFASYLFSFACLCACVEFRGSCSPWKTL